MKVWFKTIFGIELRIGSLAFGNLLDHHPHVNHAVVDMGISGGTLKNVCCEVSMSHQNYPIANLEKNVSVFTT